MRFPISILLLALLGLGLLSHTQANEALNHIDHFENKIRPLLAERCFECHGPDQQKADLRLDTREAILRGGDSGPAAVPGNPSTSTLLTSTLATADDRMPKKGKHLTEAETRDLAQWISHGLPWPADAGPALNREQRAKTHWAFQPLDPPPATTNGVHPIDALITAYRSKNAPDLTPHLPPIHAVSPAVSTSPLTGLHPSFEQLAAYENHPDPAKLIDELLASPAYGEHLARTWLDLARYADTKGYVFKENRSYPYAYTYRDWVINALNRDLPYDQFLRLQIAADRITKPLPETAHPDLAAMGFLTVGRRFLNNFHDITDDRLDVITRGTMGLTLTCARCHDHPYDPIPIEDYYSLYGVFQSSTEPGDLPIIATPERTPGYNTFEKELHTRAKKIHDFLATKHKDYKRPANILTFHPGKLDRPDGNKFRDMKQKLDAFVATSPHAPPRAMVLHDKPKPGNVHVHLRGNPHRRGEIVPRQLPEILRHLQTEPFSKGSGRLELARAITHPDNPLTARVIVNRIWLHHFGEPLVRTPSDFGLRADPPAIPALLDHLASAFMENGWSLKWLHRHILSSKTYQQAHRPLAVDPQNRFFTSSRIHRLTLEEMRDNMLRATDQLDTKRGGRSVDLLKEPFTKRRAIYGYIERQNLPGFFRTFDLASPDIHTPRRARTTSPQQALFAMNAPFVRQQAEALADATRKLKPAERVRAITRHILSRNPTADEQKDFLTFINTAPEPEAHPSSFWTYGHGHWTRETGTSFTPYPILKDGRHSGGPKLPDSNLGWSFVSATGGHPQDGGRHAIRRWTTPASTSGTITITGNLRVPAKESDGVHIRVTSSRHGLLKQLHIPGTQSKAVSATTTVQPGDHIDFIVSPGKSISHDSFDHVPVIQDGERKHNAKEQFTPKPHPPGPWTQLAQALLISNEFFFVE